MIFISGVHGVGKTHFCNTIKDRLKINIFTASELIENKKKFSFSSDKLICDIDDNQKVLLEAVEEIGRREEFVLDGHMCLLNEDGYISRIPECTFTSLKPNAIILLIDNPSIIAARRRERDGIEQSESEIKTFQDEEIKYATEIAELLSVPLKIANGSKEVDDIIEFIEQLKVRG